MTKCVECGEIVPDHSRECIVCGEDNGFPNVRAAEQADEVKALNDRVSDAWISANARGVAVELQEFCNHADISKVSICRPANDIFTLCNNDSFSYTSFANQVKSGIRVPANNEFDKIRNQFENALFPNYSENIVFGCLTINDSGITGYGGFNIILKDKMISKRASVFWENPYNFSVRHKLSLIDTIPVGYRATWASRKNLCAAKLHGSLLKGMTAKDFPAIMQSDNGGTGDSDFVEVHIFGTINLKAIAKVVAVGRMAQADRVIWRAIEKKLTDAGVETARQ